jgi:hypothetical protein
MTSATRTHLYADSGVYSPLEPVFGMVTKDQIREDGLTEEEVLDREVVEPQESVEFLPEWEEWPEEQPGENTRIEDETLIWERDGFKAQLSNIGPTKWRAEIDVPEAYNDGWGRPIDLKTEPHPEYGFVEDATFEDYTLQHVTLVLSENYQPTVEVNSYIDFLIETAGSVEEFQNDLEEKLELAQENE